MKNKLIVVPALGLAAGLSLAACGPSSGHANAEKSNFHAVASSSAVQADVAKGKALVAHCGTATHTFTGFKHCLINAVPVAQRQAVKNCLIKDGLADHLATKAGRHTFTTVSAPLCVGAALPAAGPSPKAGKS